MHLLIEHSAFLIATRGPLGYWSQQSMEASHKVTKDIFRRGTNHDGRQKGGSSAPYQIILRQSRIVVGTARSLTLEERDDSVAVTTTIAASAAVYAAQLHDISAGIFALTPEERHHCEHSNDKVVKRIKRSLVGISERGWKRRRQGYESGELDDEDVDVDRGDSSGSGDDNNAECDTDDGSWSSGSEDEAPFPPLNNHHHNNSLAAYLTADVFDEPM